MKQILRYIAIALLILLFIQCENDTGAPEKQPEAEAANSGLKVSMRTKDQLPQLTKFLQSKTRVPLFRKDTISGAVFDADNIMEVTDTLNNANYSFRFVYPETPQHIFYNLVVGVNAEGIPQTPYVLKYECDPAHFQDFAANGYNFRFFRGSVALHTFSQHFSESDLFHQTDPNCVQHDPYGDPIPCEEVTVGTGDTSGGSGAANPINNDPGTGNTGGGTGGFDITLTCACVGHNENDIEAGLCTCNNIIITINGGGDNNMNKSLQPNNCPECLVPGGNVGVNSNTDSNTDGETPPEIVIDPAFMADYPCQAQMVQEVYGNCAPLSQLFQDIFESNDNVNVTFTAEQLQGGILQGADTDGETPHNYLIRINTLRLNQSTELDLINVTTHEYVHALMFHYYYSGKFQLSGAGNPPTYAELAEGFATHRAGFGGNHHPYMASLVHDIAEVTYAWAIDQGGYNPADFTTYDEDPGDDVDGLKEFLRKLAWSGLKNTPTFEALYPNGTLEEQAIQKIIQDEIFPDEPWSTAQGNLPEPCGN